MRVLRVILVDDHRLARQRLATLLGDQPAVSIIGQASDLSEAIALLEKEPPDVVFLDVSMPPESGFDLLPHVPPGTHVVFATGMEEHAVQAHEENAVDYLLKPIRPERLSKTLERIRKLEDLAAIEEDPQGFTFATHAAIALDQIIAVAADGNYSRIYQIGGAYFHVRQPMHEWAAKLAGRGFIQPGRSLLLLASAVHHLESRSRDENYLHLMGVTAPLKLGRSITNRIRKLMGL
jgi:two-component system, LytTR family, response regulator